MWRKTTSVWRHRHKEMEAGSPSRDIAFHCSWGAVRLEQQNNNLSLTQEFRRTTDVWFGCPVGWTFLLWPFPVWGASPKPLALEEEHLNVGEAKCPRQVWKGWAFISFHHQLTLPPSTLLLATERLDSDHCWFLPQSFVSHPGKTIYILSWLVPQGRHLGGLQEGLVGSCFSTALRYQVIGNWIVLAGPAIADVVLCSWWVKKNTKEVELSVSICVGWVLTFFAHMPYQTTITLPCSWQVSAVIGWKL